MPKYVIAYRGGTKFENPLEGAAHMAKWRAWVGGPGDAVVNPGTPLGKGKLVSSDGISDGGKDLLTGFRSSWPTTWIPLLSWPNGART